MTVIVLGGGICGLGTALLLARDGHDVTLIERDADPVPASPQDAWDAWARKGITQFRQPHGDHGTWSITVMTASTDVPLRSLRHADRWMNTIRACPLQAHWVDGEPISDVLAMSGVVDRYRRFVVDGAPVATGFVAVADAWACTNPSAGRGMTVGLLHAARLRDVLRDRAADPRTIVEAFDRVTEAEVTPWYDAQIAVDRFRFAQIEALCEDRESPPPADDLSRLFVSLLTAATADPDLFRAAIEYVGTITPIQQLFRRPEVAEGVHAVTEAGRSPQSFRDRAAESCSSSSAERFASDRTVVVKTAA